MYYVIKFTNYYVIYSLWNMVDWSNRLVDSNSRN